MKETLKTLKQYVPVVARVHGGSHPEFLEVKDLYEQIVAKIKKKNPQVNDELLKLREVTGNYTVPDDVCESYEAVYRMLAELDQAFFIS